MTEPFDYFAGLKDADLPRYVLLSDFQNFELYDLEERVEHIFTLAELPDHIELFGFVIGIEKRTFRDQDPVNIQASELMGRLHDMLAESGYRGHNLERFLVRLSPVSKWMPSVIRVCGAVADGPALRIQTASLRQTEVADSYWCVKRSIM